MHKFKEIKGYLDKINSRYARILDLITYEEVLLDKKLFLRLDKEKRQIEDIALEYRKYLDLVETLTLLLSEKDAEDDALDSEILAIKRDIGRLEGKLVKMYLGLNAKWESVIIEMDYSDSLLSSKLQVDMEARIKAIAIKNNLKAEKDDKNNILIEGLNVRNIFSDYMGIWECQKGKDLGGIIIYILDNKKNNTPFDLNDVKIDTTRSSGAGGQHINTTDSAIRATHIPTKISTFCQEERSQVQNKAKALERLEKKVMEYYAGLEKEVYAREKKKLLGEIKKNGRVGFIDYDRSTVTMGDINIALNNFIMGEE